MALASRSPSLVQRPCAAEPREKTELERAARGRGDQRPARTRQRGDRQAIEQEDARRSFDRAESADREASRFGVDARGAEASRLVPRAELVDADRAELDAQRQLTSAAV